MLIAFLITVNFSFFIHNEISVDCSINMSMLKFFSNLSIFSNIQTIIERSYVTLKKIKTRLLSLILVISVVFNMVITQVPVRAFDSLKEQGADNRQDDNQSDDIIKVGDFIYRISEQTITGYTGSDTDVKIPDTLSEGEKTYPVKKIGARAFQATSTGVELKTLSLPEGLTEIGNFAFAGNSLEKLIVPKSLEKIGESGFANNKIAELSFSDGNCLKELGESSFARNRISKIDLSKASSLETIGKETFIGNGATELLFGGDGLKAIGEKAFSENSLSEVTVPSSVTAYGNDVFSGNGRYVFVKTESSSLKTQVKSGSYGSIVNPVSLWVEGYEQLKDGSKGKVILTKRELKNDPNAEKPLNQLLFKDNRINLDPPKLKGYESSHVSLDLTDATLKKYTEDNPYPLMYRINTEPPVISGLTTINVKVGESVDLRKGVTAKSSQGIDLTADIKIAPETIDKDKEGEYQVIYSVSDKAGNEAKAVRHVFVGIDPMEQDTGKGWKYKDFTYSGNTVTGLSSSGKEKSKINKDIVLPDINPLLSSGNASITAVGNYAFEKNKFTSVVIPNTVNSIGKYAFDGNQLTEVNLPETIKVVEEYSFSNNSLQRLSIPEGVTEIRNCAFYKNKLNSISFPEGLKKIGDYAFYNNSIEALGIPESVESIGSYAFGNNRIKNVKLQDSVKYIGKGAFSDNLITSYKLPSGLTEIPEELFKNNKIANLVLNENIEKIGNNAFEGNSFRAFEIPSHIKEIGNYAFYNNSDLKFISLNEGLTKIGAKAFYKTALNMDELVIPKTVKEIGSYAFAADSGTVSIIKKVFLPEKIEKVGEGAFKKINLREVNIPKSLTTLENYVFAENKLTSINIPDTITRIGDHAFYSNFLTTLELPENVKSIGISSFSQNKLTYVKLNDSIESVGRYAFSSNSLPNITFPEKINVIEDGVCQYNRSMTSVSFKGPITKIGDYAFSDSGLTQVSILDTVKEIGYQAFYCNKLSNIVLPDSVEKIGGKAFYGNNLTDVKFPINDKFTVLESDVFANNNLSEITLPKSVKTINNCAFSSNNLINVKIDGENLETIDYGAFLNNSLESIEVPKSLKKIDKEAFKSNPGWSGNPYFVNVLIKDGDKYVNPNNINDEKTYVINQGMITVTPYVVDEEGNPVAQIGPPYTVYGKIGEETIIEPTESKYYVPVSEKTTVKFEEKSADFKMLYTSSGDKTPTNVKVDLIHANTSDYTKPASNKYGVSTRDYDYKRPFILKLSLTDNDTNYDNAEITIDLNRPVAGGHVKDVFWPSDIGNIFSSYKLENGVIRLKFKDTVTAATVLEMPFQLLFDETTAPYQFTLDLSGQTTFSNNGLTVATSDPNNYIGTRNTYRRSSSEKKTNTDLKYMGILDKDGYMKVGSEIPVPYFCNAGLYSPKRSLEKTVFIDKIPEYEARGKDGKSEKRKAKFIPELSPGWVLSEDGETVICTIYNKGAVVSLDKNKAPVLYFSYPEIKDGYEVLNTVKSTVYTRDTKGVYEGTSEKFKGAETEYTDEKPTELSASNRRKIFGKDSEKVLDVPAAGIPVPKAKMLKRCTNFYGDSSNRPYGIDPPRSTSINYYYNNRKFDYYSGNRQGYNNISDCINYHAPNAFRDNEEDRHSEFTWGVEMEIINSSAENVFMKDFGLDSRMKYTGIKIPKEFSSAEMKLYKSDDCTGEPFITKRIYGDRVDFDEEMQKARSFTLKFDGVIDGKSQLFTASLVTLVYTRLINPDEKQYRFDNDKKYSEVAGTSSNNEFHNKSSFTYDAFNYNLDDTRKSEGTLSASSEEYIVVLPWESYATFNKVLIEKQGNIKTYAANETVKFDLSTTTVKPVKSKMKNFKCVDVLPDVLVPQKVLFTRDFIVHSVNPKYEFVENFQNSGKWAVIITADEYNPAEKDMDSRTEKFATLETATISGKPSREYINNAYLSAIGDGCWEMDGEKTKPTITTVDGKTEKIKEFDAPYKNVLSSDAKFTMLSSSMVYGRKSVKRAEDKVWYTDVEVAPGGDYDYRLQMFNEISSTAIKYVEFYDILPHNGDYRVCKNKEDKFVPRGTDLTGIDPVTGKKVEGTSHMRGPIRFNVPKGMEDYFTPYYCIMPFSDLDQKNPEEIVNNSAYWVTEENLPKVDGKTDWSRVTAFKVIGYKDDNTNILNSEKEFSVTVPMKAPDYENYSLDEKKAYTTFGLRYSQKSKANGINSQNFVEGNEVYTSMKMPRGSIDIQKSGHDITKPKDQQTYNLPGATFRVYPVYNPVLDKNKDVTDTKLFTPVTVDGTTYYVSTEPMSFKDEGDNTYVDLKTDKTGYAHFGDLRYDRDYIVEEGSAPDGYKLENKDKYRLVKSEQLKADDGYKGITHVLNIQNEKIIKPIVITPVKGSIEFRKLDAYGNSLSGTIFRLEGGSPKNPIVRYASSTETGLVTFEGLPLFGEKDLEGNRIPPYKITEVGPRGNLRPIEPIEFKLTNRKKDGKPDVEFAKSLVSGGATVDTVNIDKNGNPRLILNPIKNDVADLNVYKLGIFSIKDQDKLPSELRNTSGKRLAGVKFEVTGIFEDNLLPKTKEFTTDKDGSIKLEGLMIGKEYTVKEINLPEGFRHTPPKKDADGHIIEDDKTKDNIKIRVDGTGNIYINDRISVYNYAVFPNYPEKNTNRVDIRKTDEKNNLLEGVKFGLYEIKNPGQPGETAEKIQEKVTAEEGTIAFEDFGMTDGKYTEKTFEVREISGINGYLPKFKPFRFTTNNTTSTYYMLDAVNPEIELTVVKSEEGKEDEPVSGAEFTLYEGPDGNGEALSKAVTGKDGKLTFDYHEYDINKQYSVKETKVPEGYSDENSGKVYLFDLAGLKDATAFDGKQEIRVTNKRIKGAIQIEKLDDQTNEPVIGAEFGLFEEGNDKPVMTAKTDKDGIIIFDNLDLHKEYTVKEIKAPAGYKINEKINDKITIESADKVHKTYYNSRVSTNFSIDKTAEKGLKVKGAEFTLDEQYAFIFYRNPVVKSTDGNGALSFNNLEQGRTYRLRETSVKDAEIVGGEARKFKENNSVWYIKVVKDEKNLDNSVLKITDKDGKEISLDENGNLPVENRTIEPTDVKVKKIWKDAPAEHPDVYFKLTRRLEGHLLKEDVTDVFGNACGIIKAEGNDVYTQTAVWTNLPKTDISGKTDKTYTYFVEEVDKEGNPLKLDHYTMGDVETDGDNYNFKVTNSYEHTDVTAKKVWNDGNDQDGIRKDVKLHLIKTVEDKTEDIAGSEKTIKKGATGNDLKVSWKDLPNYEAGKLITYRVVEEKIDDYDTEITSNDNLNYTVTNTHKPAETDITVTKVWDDNDNQDGKRQDVKLHLTKTVDGKKEEEVKGSKKVIKKDATGEDLKATWENLPKFESGKLITYKVVEADMKDYTTVIKNDGERTFVITNKHTPEVTDISATKVWDDNNNQDGKRKDVTFHLTKEIKGQPAVKIEGSERTINKDATGSDLTVKWENMPKYESGKLIKYKVVEDRIEGYDTKVEGKDYSFTVTNKHVPEVTEISATKIWKDNDNQDGKREDITLYLTKEVEGQPVKVEGSEKTVKKDAEGKDLTVKWENMPKYEDGELLNYNVIELKAPEGYQGAVKKVEGKDYDFEVTNSYTPKLTQITAIKVWNDGNNQDGIRDEVRLHLRKTVGDITSDLDDSEKIIMKDATGDDLTATWNDLPKYESGKLISYNVVEDPVKGYETEIKQDEANVYRFIVTNSHTPEVTEVIAEKVWNDDSNRDGLRKDITLQLSKTVDGKESLLDLDRIIKKDAKGEELKAVWTGLPKYEDGKLIEYNVKEKEVPEGYKAEVMKDKDTNGFIITNTHEPEHISISGKKTWDDGNNADKLRPESIKVHLLAYGKVIATVDVKPNSKGEWKYTFDNLYKYVYGEEIEYTVSEEPVTGYEAKVEGFNITNTHKPAKPSKKSNRPKTGDSSDIFLPAMGIMASGAMIFIFRRRKYDSSES